MLRRGRKSLLTLIALAVVLAGIGLWVHERFMGPATSFDEGSKVLYIPSGADLGTVIDSLSGKDALPDERVFRWLCERKKYGDRIKPGRYRIARGMTMNAMINMLRSGEQEPVMVAFSNVDDLPELAGRLARKLEPDSLAFLKAFMDPEIHRSAGLDRETFISLFIPDTYEFWWTTTPEGFIARMTREHDRFWDTGRRSKAAELGLSVEEVATLASIVQAETVRMSDAPRIAGVYLNRLRIGMPLQADPTLKFALGLDSINRVLDRDKTIDSPYNTYRNKGLPPGPINMPEARFLDAVLKAESHDYLYFCARSDLSGHSEFSRTYEQHLVHARRYQRALNERGIYR